MNRKIVLGFSGGMDSAYSALLLKDLGYDVIAVNLIMHKNCDFSKAAEYTAEKLNIPLIVEDVSERFEQEIAIPFSKEYVSGITPNPCIMCNPAIKFKSLFDIADRIGAKFVATGHYVKKIYENDRYSFAPAADTTKDQAYFLYRLPQCYMERLIFPLDGIQKSIVKEYFNGKDMLSTDKESYDICFIGNNSYEDIVSQYVELPPTGDIIDVNGKRLGIHKGIHAYTVGQRKGLGVALGIPAFVSNIDPKSNTVTLSFANDSFVQKFSVNSLCFLLRSNVDVGDSFYVKVRYRARPVKCTVDSVSELKVSVVFEEPQKPLAFGQSAVFYDDRGLIVFGGVICKEN